MRNERHDAVPENDNQDDLGSALNVLFGTCGGVIYSASAIFESNVAAVKERASCMNLNEHSRQSRKFSPTKPTKYKPAAIKRSNEVVEIPEFLNPRININRDHRSRSGNDDISAISAATLEEMARSSSCDWMQDDISFETDRNPPSPARTIGSRSSGQDRSGDYHGTASPTYSFSDDSRKGNDVSKTERRVIESPTISTSSSSGGSSGRFKSVWRRRQVHALDHVPEQSRLNQHSL